MDWGSAGSYWRVTSDAAGRRKPRRVPHPAWSRCVRARVL